MLTDRDFGVLIAVDSYHILSRPQIQGLCFPTDNTGRVTRRRLQHLVSQGLLNRHRPQVVYANSSPAGSVYYPGQKGCRLLAEHTGDDRHLLTPTECPLPHNIMHSLAVSDTHIRLDAAIAGQKEVQLSSWVNEWDIVNRDETDAENRFRLYTLLEANPRLICAPDAAFMLSTQGLSKVFYLEQDRGTTGVQQVVARKYKGFHELLARGLHRHHFPETNVNLFTVLCVTNSVPRRNALCRALKGKDGAQLWKICSATELTEETVLFDPIWHDIAGAVMPLVKRLPKDK